MWQTFSNVPRDGRIVWLWAEDADGPFPMRWNPIGFNPLVSSNRGIWETEGREFTWCDENPDGAPTHWHPDMGSRVAPVPPVMA